MMTTGLYTSAHAARLVQMKSARVRRWLGAGSAKAVVAGRTPQPLVGFHDLVELIMIRDLVERHGMKVGRIRDSVREAAERTGVSHPLAAGQLHVDGLSLYLKQGEDKRVRAPAGEPAAAARRESGAVLRSVCAGLTATPSRRAPAP
ncbi:MAG: hypothetical protein ACI9K2_007138, partial [Myxococcota bacterium]